MKIRFRMPSCDIKLAQNAFKDHNLEDNNSETGNVDCSFITKPNIMLYLGSEQIKETLISYFLSKSYSVLVVMKQFYEN